MVKKLGLLAVIGVDSPLAPRYGFSRSHGDGPCSAFAVERSLIPSGLRLMAPQRPHFRV